MEEKETLIYENELKKERIKEDVKTHGILFNFKDEKGNLKTGIIRKGQWKDDLFKDNWLPESWCKMTRRERRHL